MPFVDMIESKYTVAMIQIIWKNNEEYNKKEVGKIYIISQGVRGYLPPNRG